MTDLFTLTATVLVCLALAQLNIVLFGIVKRALQDKAILGDKEIIVVSSEDEEADGEEIAEETEDAANERQEAEETNVNAAEESGESAKSEQIADLAAKVATLAAKTEAKQ